MSEQRTDSQHDDLIYVRCAALFLYQIFEGLTDVVLIRDSVSYVIISYHLHATKRGGTTLPGSLVI